MVEPVTLHGPRLRLRPWRLPEDLAPVFAINRDPVAMRWFMAPMTEAENEAWCRRLAAHFDAEGWGFWVVEWPGLAPVVGVVGLMRVTFNSWFTPAVEVGWRVAPAFQRRGVAAEAARLALDYGFGELGLPEIVAFTVPGNEPSWRLMERLGMERAGEFGHPRVPEDHALHRHLLYRLAAPA